jgi:hypothetical protein
MGRKARNNGGKVANVSGEQVATNLEGSNLNINVYDNGVENKPLIKTPKKNNSIESIVYNRLFKVKRTKK